MPSNKKRPCGRLSVNFYSTSTKELFELFQKIEDAILKAWHTPIDNDFLVMIFYGLLRKLTRRWGFDKEHPAIYNDLLSNISGVLSVKQTERLAVLGQIIENDTMLRNLFLRESNSEIWRVIKEKRNNEDFTNAFEAYLKEFGIRFANELKLEEPDIEEKPEKFIELMKLYAKISPDDLDAKRRQHEGARERAEQYIRQHANVIEGWVFFFVLRETRRYLKNREEMRLARARIFGFVRRIFIGIGKRLSEQELIEDSEDVFYLEIGEVAEFISGSLSSSHLKSLISKRQRDYGKFRTEEWPSRFVTRGNAQVPIMRKASKAIIDGGKYFEGIPSSSGVAAGVVKVMTDLDFSISPDAKILVAEHTDPGWTPLFSRFEGIIVEYGGQLSHAAIVSRELGIPCVVGVPNITKLLKDGDYIQMDGGNGKITLQVK